MRLGERTSGCQFKGPRARLIHWLQGYVLGVLAATGSSPLPTKVSSLHPVGCWHLHSRWATHLCCCIWNAAGLSGQGFSFLVSSKSESCGPSLERPTVPRLSGCFQEFVAASYQPRSGGMARAVQSPSDVVALSRVLHVTSGPGQQGARVLPRTHRTALTSCDASRFRWEPQASAVAHRVSDGPVSIPCVARSSAGASSSHRMGAIHFIIPWT